MSLFFSFSVSVFAFGFLCDRCKGKASSVCFHAAIPQKEVFIFRPEGTESIAVMMFIRLPALYMKM